MYERVYINKAEEIMYTTYQVVSAEMRLVIWKAFLRKPCATNSKWRNCCDVA